MIPIRTVRLTSTDKTYQRPKHTFQEKLSQAEIEEKLADYVEVEDIGKVPLNSHIRYFLNETDPKTGQKKRLFRFGGILTNKEHADKFVILSNGRLSWSVQVDKATFYKKMTIDEIKEGHALIIEQYKDKIKEQKRTINKLKDKIEELERYIKRK
jgi:hypothetical protein